ncbi:MAG: acyltransferase [Terrimonas sp.]|nr:acyltransferase [Terrimonas sp.]
MTNGTGKLNSIQALRAIAVILVLHCHTLDLINTRYQSDFFYLQNFGAAGVDLFFVISGFIITIVSGRYAQTGSGRYFFIRRAIRVLPLYWIVSFAAVVLFRIQGGHWPETRELIIILLPFPSPSFAAPFLVQGWTLYFEILFYTLIAITIQLNSKRYILYTCLLLLIAILLNYLTRRHFYPLNIPGNGFMLEFLMGMVAGRLYLSKTNISKGMAICITAAGIAGLLITLIKGYGNISEMGYVFNGKLSLERSLLWGIPCTLLVTGLTMLEKKRPLKMPGILIEVGNASFSLYLIHLLILDYENTLWSLSGINRIVESDILVVFSMGLSLTVGWIFYRLVERPLLHQLSTLLTKR